jgi:putative transcriptional regulator
MGEAVIHNCIRRLRFDHGEMTQQQLADLAGCTRQTIILLEQQRYSPSLTLAFRIARVFKTGIEDVFQFDEN